MTEEQGEHMVRRFLGWKLPDNFAPDGGITFDPIANRGTEFERKVSPIGTNPLDMDQATDMVRFMIDGLPSNGA